MDFLTGMAYWGIILLAVVLLGGCAVGPDYKRPVVDVPQSFRFEDKEAKDLANTAGGSSSMTLS
jgi:uncharacterized lipoprotein